MIDPKTFEDVSVELAVNRVSIRSLQDEIDILEKRIKELEDLMKVKK